MDASRGTAAKLLGRRRVHLTERYFDIGENLYRLRRSRVLTQKQLAKRANVHVITISNLETGAQHASPETVQRLAEALSVDVAELTREADATQ